MKIVVSLKDYSYIYKNFDDLSDDHPIRIAEAIENKDLLEYLEGLLYKLQGVKGLSDRIEEIKRDKKSFYSFISELKVAAFLKDKSDDLEIIPPSKKVRNPDIKIIKNGRDFFVEVKRLSNLENKIFEEIHQISSPYFIKVATKGLLNENEINSLIEFIKQKIDAETVGEFPNDFGDLIIENKDRYGIKYEKNQKTYLMITQKEVIRVDFDKVKERVLLDFYAKLDQLTNESPTIWAIDLERWCVDEEDIERLVYGTIFEDKGILFKPRIKEVLNSLSQPYFDKIVKAYQRDMALMLKCSLLPTLYYRKTDGLFLRDEVEVLNGVLVFRYNKIKFYPNPFVKDEQYVYDIASIFTDIQ
ncbi:MAG: hypothetical protein PHY36_01530 [Methanocellales archaeon]|nr:hypothetical protein [Methanocellales archaeon]